MERLERAGLTREELKVADLVVAQESARREHVVVYLSGAHAYGFPSPDSDLDLKAIHLARTRDLLGLEPPPMTVDRAEVLAGVEIDYTSNELGHAIGGILGGNGNFIERVLGKTMVHAHPLLEELAPLAQASLSRRVHRHYRGFASNQAKMLEREPTVKKLLYVLRTALTGVHLLRAGVLETDLRVLAEAHGIAGVSELIAIKRAGERTGADPALLEAWSPILLSVVETLDEARQTSALPEEPSNADAFERWLVDVRIRSLR